MKDTSAALSFDSEHRLRSENLSFDIDVWYPKLKQFTFESVFIPLKREEAESILAFHDYSWRNTSKVLTSYDIAVLKALEASIDNELKHLCKGTPDAFIRLCGRSPKDGEPLDRITAIQKYNVELDRLSSEGLDVTDPNSKMIAISRVPLMKISSGADAMSLLLTSERVFAEMVDWLKYGEPEQICLRKWEPELSLDYEFRVFVYEGQITAISQYDHYTYYPYLQPLKKMLKEGIYRLWKEIHPLVNDSSSSYVIDIAYLPTSGVFRLVELSPFTPCTGPALFHWQWDKEILQGCGKPDEKLVSADDENGHELSESDVAAINKIVFRLKEKKDLHPQLGIDLVELNWDMRWKQDKIPFHQYYEMAREENSKAVAADTANSGVFSGIFNWLTGCTSGTAASSPASPTTITASSNTGEQTVHYLFVYGTLKSGFHWNSKYLHSRLGDVHCVSHNAVTVLPMALVVGDCGVPYLLQLESGNGENSDNSGVCHCVRGELWCVDDNMLKSLDEYEGVGDKGYYSRINIAVKYTAVDTSTDHTVEANVYVLSQPTPDLLQRERIPEYTLEYHQRHYKPVRHIQVKQYKYIGQHSTWGKTNDMIDIVKSDKPHS